MHPPEPGLRFPNQAAATGHGDVELTIEQLCNLDGAPAFVRRGQDVEDALDRLHGHCRRIRAEMLGMVGLTVAVAEPGAADPHGANAEIAATAHRLADMLRDGRIDHREAPELEERFLALSQDLTGYVRASRAQRGAA